MFSAINWHDQYTLTKERIIYTQEQHHVPGIHALARHTMKDSIPLAPFFSVGTILILIIGF